MESRFFQRIFLVILCFSINLEAAPTKKQKTNCVPEDAKNMVRKSALDNLLAELGKSSSDLKAISKSELTALLGEIAAKYANGPGRSDQTLQNELEKLRNENARIRTRLSVIDIGEAAGRMFNNRNPGMLKDRNPENMPDAIPPFGDTIDENDYYLKTRRDQASHQVESFVGAALTFEDQFNIVYDAFVNLYRAYDYLILTGQSNVFYELGYSEDVLKELRTGNFLRRWAKYCRKFGEPSDEESINQSFRDYAAKYSA